MTDDELKIFSVAMLKAGPKGAKASLYVLMFTIKIILLEIATFARLDQENFESLCKETTEFIYVTSIKNYENISKLKLTRKDI